MRPSLLIAGLCLLVLAFAPAPFTAKKSDHGKLQGTWKVIEYIADGKSLAGKEGIPKRIVISRDKVEFPDKEIEWSYKLKLHPTTTPKAFDITRTSKESTATPALGIYELKGDTLKICLSVIDDIRPKEFKESPTSLRVLIVFKRVKP